MNDDRIIPFGRDVDEMQRNLDSLKTGDGGGTYDDMTGDWKTDVERQLAQLHGDVRNLLYGLVAGFLLIAGAGWVAYDKLNDQMTGFRAELSTTRIDQVKAIGEVQTRNAEINGKIDVLLERKKVSD